MQREMDRERVAVSVESAKVGETVKEEQAAWIEDEVEELERWDGME
jgi:hypothetical protein